MHYQCNLAAVAGSRCTGARSGVVTERGSRGIGAAQKVLSPHTAAVTVERPRDKNGTKTHARADPFAPRQPPRTLSDAIENLDRSLRSPQRSVSKARLWTENGSEEKRVFWHSRLTHTAVL